MKLYAVVVVSLILVLPSAACAQSCYTPVVAMLGTYDMSGAGSGKDSLGVYDWTVSHQLSDSPMLPLAGDSCAGVTFGGQDSTATATVSDFGTAKCAETPDTLNITGGPTFMAVNVLNINAADGNYQFSQAVDISATYTFNSCGSISTSTAPFSAGPGDSSCTSNLIFPTYPLPAKIGPLTQSGVGFAAGACVGGAVNSNWTLGFTFTPIVKDDKDCKQKGGSTVGCLNQSLGEDVALVGTGFSLHYEGSRVPVTGGESVASNDALMIGGWTLSVHHVFSPATQTLYLGDGNQRNGYQLGSPMTYLGNTLITSESGGEVYVFSPTGQHLQTLRPLTGAVLYTFGYDSAGNLITVTDANANVTTIKRNPSEHVTGIVSPYAQTTSLSLDKNGFLTQVKDPLGKLASFTNDSNGLIISRTDANGNVYNYTYDNAGKLIKDADPVGGFHALARTNATTGLGWTVGHTTAMGASSSFQSDLQLPWAEGPNATYSRHITNVWPDGLQSTGSLTLLNGQIANNIALPDGTSQTQTSAPDPVWGLQAPLITSELLTQGNQTMLTTSTRAVTLGAVGNPFSVATANDTDTVNGRLYTSNFTGSTLTFVRTSPVNRTATIVMDSQERPASTQVTGLTASVFAYTAKGKLASITQGTRRTSFAYNTKGFLTTTLDPLKLKTSLAYDADGNILSATLPDGRIVSHTYDGNGNLLSVTPPGKSAHTFTYTEVDLPASYTSPGGAPATTFTYDLDRNITSMVRPGSQTVAYDYDTAGRMTKVVIPTATESFAYGSTTGNLSSATRGTERVSYSYLGPLLTKSTWTGTVAGNIARAFNNNFWVTSQSVNGGTALAFRYDNDGLVTNAGALTVKRSRTNGLITGTTLGLVTDTRSYNSFGELTSYSASVNGAPAYKYQLTLNADGMITAKSETIGAVTNTYAYTYDLANRLTATSKNGGTDNFTYDTNSNRLTAITGSGTANATYDAQDRLVTYGATAFAYTQAGDTSSQTTGTQRTSYTYDALGNLTAVKLPNGTTLTYVIDGENNRVGKLANGVYTTGFLYDDDRIVAQLNGSNQLVSQFVYAAGLGSPDYMISGSSTYRLVHDPVGSPVLVIDTATGTIAQQITYDEFGNILSDTNPGFQPFGFAGGLYDQDTKLVRFGARDYNPAVGRWTAKDPTLFSGGDTNLYDYAQTDPVNQTDLTGLGDCKKKEERKKKAKELADKVAKKIAGDKLKVGPVNVSTNKPEISAGTSVEVKVGGQTVASGDGEVAVGITPGNDPNGPLIYVDTNVAIKVGKWTIWEKKTHTETLDTNDWWVANLARNRKDPESICPQCEK